jgi:hypothetical protein
MTTLASIKIGDIHREVLNDHPHGEVIPGAHRLRLSALS